MTLLGNITYLKHLYRDKEGHYRCLLDEALGLKPNQRTSSHYQKTVGLFSFIAGSYRNAQEFLQHCFGDSVSFECIPQQVQAQGSQIQKEEEYTFDRNLQETLKKTAITTTKPSKETLYLEVDGTIIHLHKQTEEEKGRIETGHPP